MKKRSWAMVILFALSSKVVAACGGGGAVPETRPQETSADAGAGSSGDSGTEAATVLPPDGKAGLCPAGRAPPFVPDKTLYPYAHRCFAALRKARGRPSSGRVRVWKPRGLP